MLKVIDFEFQDKMGLFKLCNGVAIAKGFTFFFFFSSSERIRNAHVVSCHMTASYIIEVFIYWMII